MLRTDLLNMDTLNALSVDMNTAEVDHTPGLWPYPRFSLAERDRRWKAVRELMSEQEIDVIVAPANTGHATDFQADARWLSHCGGGGETDIACVFPVDGEVTVTSTTAKARWETTQTWVTDLREARRNYGRVIAERLTELNPKKIGIVGLGAGTRTPEGTLLHGTYLQIVEAVPKAELVDATPILARVRQVKSLEEIAFLTKSTELIQMAVDAVLATARPGEIDWVVWAAAHDVMLRGGSELPVHCNWISGARPGRTLSRPSHRVLEQGDMIMNELEASWGGYRAQMDIPVAVGQPDPVYQELIKVQEILFDRSLEMLKPGITLGELQAKCAELAVESAPKSGPAAGAQGEVTMHGRGQGDDGPIITATARDPKQLSLALRENMVFILKPSAKTEDGTYNLTWGDTVVVTKKGGLRLSSRPHGIAIAGE